MYIICILFVCILNDPFHFHFFTSECHTYFEDVFDILFGFESYIIVSSIDLRFEMHMGQPSDTASMNLDLGRFIEWLIVNLTDFPADINS